jgi:nickel/cobalt transporter (NicO) family protein
MDTNRPTHVRWLLPLVVLLCVLCVSVVNSHPVPRRNHDRTIIVRLTGNALVVDYRLELDEFTGVYIDLPAVMERAELAALSSPAEFYQAFMERYAPILGDNLLARLDQGELLSFRCVKYLHRTQDENGQALDHLRFDFRFEAPWPAGFAGKHRLAFEEGNYKLEEGLIALALRGEAPVEVAEKTEPEKSLQESRTLNLKPGDDDKRRRVAATFVLPDTLATAPTTETADLSEPAEHSSLLNLLLDTKRGLLMLLILATGFGAVHALTPGHGKTLVAAYLVGERGTVWHALVLGLVTTATHTGTVILLAGGLLVLYPDTVPSHLRVVLGLGGGLLVAGLGIWLLFRRLAGQADHVHLGGHGHHHHHHHGPLDHYHDEHGHSHPIKVETRAGLGGLIVLGVSGGIIPCWDAIAMFGFAISAQRLWLALPLLLAFSAGLAGILIVVGILVVRLKGAAASRWENSQVIRALPLISAALVTIMGLWLCYDSIHHPV